MKTEIGIYDITHCSNLDFRTRIEIYKKVGFHELALYLDNSYMQGDETYLDILTFARDRGFKINQVHIDYKISNSICDTQSNIYFDYLEEKAKECEVLNIPYLVLHASKGDNPPIVKKSQLVKLKSLVLNHPKVFFCFENVRNNSNLEKILGLDEKNIKMCYDLGHAHAYDNEFALLEKFKDKIICSHLHNNFGSDTHNILTDGEIDYAPILSELSKIKNISSCIEAFPKMGSKLTKSEFENFVKACFKSVNL